jgi:hypothetical protein
VKAGYALRHWIVECDCGDTFEVTTAALLTDGQRSCRSCANRKRGRSLAAKYAGRTISELARIAGVNETTIRQRIRLGWPVDRLAAPRHHDTRRRSAA